MIYGTGDLSKALTDRNLFTFFAKGVSNSLCIDEAEFARERMQFLLATNMHPNNRFVYFSTLSIYDKNTPYTRFKLQQEAEVRKLPKYCIVRLGNITWGKNPHTIINTFKRQIANNEPSRIDNYYKYICTLEEFKYWINLIPDFNTEMNITGERLTIQEIYNGVKCGHYDGL